MNKLHSILLNFILVGVLMFLNGCSTTKSLPNLQQTSPLPAKNICNIAVLPFVNESLYRNGDFIVYRVFKAELTRAGNFNLLQEGDIREIYRQLKIYPNSMPDNEQLSILGNRLDADMLVTGRIIEMTEDIMAGELNPSLAIVVQAQDARNGRLIWTSYHKRQGTDYRKVLHFGKLNTIVALSKQVSHELLTLWLKRGLQGCEK